MNEINALNTALIVIDMQAKLLPAMASGAAALERTALLVKGAAELGIRTVVSEQYPKGLGPTVPELAALLPEGTAVVPKTAFSVFREPAFCTELLRDRKECLIFAGVEAHVCVYQSVMAALKAGYRAGVAADAVSSRKGSDAELALAQLRAAGATVMSAEAWLFMLLEDAASPHFKAVSRLVR